MKRLVLIFIVLVVSTSLSFAEVKKKVLILGLDGMRPDAFNKANTPNLDALIANGVYDDKMRAEDATWSAPNWATILTGVWRDKHGIKDNSCNGSNLENIPDVFGQIEAQQPSLKTVKIANWTVLHNDILSGADDKLHQDYGGGVPFRYDDWAIATTLDVIEQDSDVIFSYMVSVDEVGHMYGFNQNVSDYMDQIEFIDAKVGEFMNQIQSRPTYSNEDWLIVGITDHGGTPTEIGWSLFGGGHGENILEHRITWMFASGAAVPHKGYRPYTMSHVDIPATVLDFLGLASNDDGKSVLNLPEKVAAFNTNLISNGDAETDRGFSDFDVEGSCNGWNEVAGVIPMKYNSYEAPTGTGNFFVGSQSNDRAISQKIDVSNLDLSNTTVNVSADLGGFADQADSASIVARFYSDKKKAVFSSGNNVYFFNGDQYSKFYLDDDEVASGYPKQIRGNWPGLDQFTGGAKNIDAVFKWYDVIYFFKGDEYIKYNWTWDYTYSGYPKNIKDHWSGLDRFEGGAKDLDGATGFPGGTIHFFKNNQYCKFSMAADSTYPRYPRYITQNNWPGLHLWPEGIDGVFRKNDFTAYFFREGQYANFSIPGDAVLSGYPSAIDANTWPGLSNWYLNVNSLQLESVTAADRNNETKLMHKEVSAAIPSDTKEIEVTVYFDTVQGTGDGSADNISLILNK